MIEQLEQAGIINTDNLSDDVRNAIDARLNQDMVNHLISFHQTLKDEHVEYKPLVMSDDEEDRGGMF